MTEGKLLARNSALNFIGLALPMLAALLTIPWLVRGLGAERFGILTLAWAAIGYFSLFELGLSRALTQRAALHVGSDDAGELGAVAGSALALLLASGVLGGALIAWLTPTLVTRVLNVPTALQQETLTSFYILAASLPFVMTSAGLRGLMEAQQHFGAVNALRVPMIAFMFVGPLLVLPFSKSLVPAVTMLAVGRAVSWGAHLFYCLKRYAFLAQSLTISRMQSSALLRFGGWTTITNIVSPIMVYLDRFAIGALLPIAAVAHYVTPHELVIRVLVIPGAILGAMFPAFAAASLDTAKFGHLYGRALRAVLVCMFPAVLVLVAFAGEGLSLWVGSVLPPQSATVLQILAIGVFINAVGQVPYAAMQGAGRPELIAKLHLVELPLYLGALYLLIRELGIVGVAVAWTLRVATDSAALAWVADRVLGLKFTPITRGRAWPGLIAAMLAILTAAALPDALVVRVTIVALALTVFVPMAWRVLLSASERNALRGWLQSQRALASDEIA